eukprot:5284034-Prymnesium_polylepis.2
MVSKRPVTCSDAPQLLLGSGASGHASSSVSRPSYRCHTRSPGWHYRMCRPKLASWHSDDNPSTDERRVWQSRHATKLVPPGSGLNMPAAAREQGGHSRIKVTRRSRKASCQRYERTLLRDRVGYSVLSILQLKLKHICGDVARTADASSTACAALRAVVPSVAESGAFAASQARRGSISPRWTRPCHRGAQSTPMAWRTRHASGCGSEVVRIGEAAIIARDRGCAATRAL